MDLSLTDNTTRFLLHEAYGAARRICRELRLAAHDVDDVGQDLLVDFLARLPAFRNERGSLGAFANVVFHNRASRIGAWVRRERAVLGLCVSIDQPIDEDDGISLGDTIPEAAGYPAMLGQHADQREGVELRVSVLAGLARLDAEDRGLCDALSGSTVDELVEAGVGARSTLYRRLDRIRLDLTAFGIGPI
jgi:DNA-directed RNA polymerase specialized sigma24 family protein